MAEIIVDNEDAGFSKVGTWIYYVGQGWDNTIEYKLNGTGTAYTTWNAGALDAGTYEIYVHWSCHSNRASDAPYTIYHKGVIALPTVSGAITGVADNIDETGGANPDTTTIDVDQQDLADGTPTGDTGGPSGWCYIGTYEFDGVNDAIIVMTDDANEYVIADAVRFVSLNPTISGISSIQGIQSITF